MKVGSVPSSCGVGPAGGGNAGEPVHDGGDGFSVAFERGALVVGEVEVVEDGQLDHIGQAPFERPHGLHRGLALGEAAPVVGAAGRVVAQLHDGHDVQDRS